jgi:2,4-dienoyl-CoA reductase-like NADH-dependent reductase (Old Yellow Enzyme family)
MMREYYVQPASAGLMLTEATSVTPMGVGYPDTPGIWSDEQVAGWRHISDAVHAAGGTILLQLWHVMSAASRTPPISAAPFPLRRALSPPRAMSAFSARCATSSSRVPLS